MRYRYSKLTGKTAKAEILESAALVSIVVLSSMILFLVGVLKFWSFLHNYCYVSRNTIAVPRIDKVT